MALSGSLRTLSLAEIFQTLARSNATGILRLSSSEGRVDVVFDQGWIIGLHHRDQGRDWSVQHRLLAYGALGEDMLDTSGSGGYATLERLVASGLVERERADDALTNHVFDELCDLFTWDSASFMFHETQDQDGDPNEISGTSMNLSMQYPVQIEVQSLLMESARRLDEWHRILPDLPPDESVVAFVPGREIELETRFSEYPERPVMALVDGIRTIGEIARHTPVTHMDVHTVLFDAVCEGVLEVLTPEVMESRARDLLRLEDPYRAARLLRSCLALEPNRDSATVLLAESLEQLGDPPEAADCYATLALSFLQDDRVQDAIGAARKAVAIDDSDQMRQILVRCLVENGDNAEAAQQLAAIGLRKVGENRLDEARGTLRQVLQLDPDNHEARRQLAQILEDENTGDEVVVCVECGGQNQRGREECEVCQAPLFLTCLNCNRAVAISDRICVFCGANPHVNEVEGRGLTRAGPSTTALIRASEKEGSGTGKHDAIRGKMAAAREHERAERFAEALAIWQELAAEQQGNARLTKHIRALQQLVHDAEVEVMIERAHQLRRGRRYHRALRGYKRARQAISPEDPRAAKIESLIAATRRNSQLTTLIYAAAFAILGLVTWLVVQPIYELRGFKAEVLAAQKKLDATLSQAEGAAGFKRAQALIPDHWAAQAEDLGPEAELAYGDLRQRLEAARLRLGSDAIAQIADQLDAGDWQEAQQGLEAFRSAFGNQVLAEERSALEDRVAQRRAAAAAVPERLAAADSLIAEGRLPEAIAALEDLRPVAEGDDATAVARRLEDLAARRAAFESALEAAATAAGTDLELAATRLAALEEDARRWNRAEAVAELAQRVASARDAAREAYRSLGRPYRSEDLEGFLAAHGTSAEATIARRELGLLQEQAERRERALAEGVERWREARAAGRLEAAWKAAQDLHRTYPEAARDADVRLPLRLATGTSQARLVVDGEAVASADGDGVILWWHLPLTPQSVRVEAAGFDPRSADWRDLAAGWDHALSLERAIAWQWQGPERVYRLVPLEATALAVSGRALVALQADGRVAWQQQVGSADEMLGGFRLPSWAHVTRWEDWILAPLGEGGLRILDRSGEEVASVPGDPLAAPPRLYVNELLGGDLRLAMVAGRTLVHGSLDSGPAPAPEAGEVISGPAVAVAGVDRLLLAGTIDGQMVAVDDSTGGVVWRLDLQATDIGLLHPVGVDRILVVLDGSRLACIQVQDEGGRLAWELPLEGSVVGEPQVVDGRSIVTVGDQIYAIDTARGARRLVARLPGPASVAAVAYADRVHAAYESNGSSVLLCSDNDGVRWQRSLPASATALITAGPVVIVGLAAGQVLAFEP